MDYSNTTKLYHVKYDSAITIEEDFSDDEDDGCTHEWVDLDHVNTDEAVVCWNVKATAMDESSPALPAALILIKKTFVLLLTLH